MAKKKFKFKGLYIILALIMVLTSFPLTAMAAPASDIPTEMLDNVYLDALAYTGYDVQAQKNDGTIMKIFGSAVPASVRSDIGYGLGPSGLETVSNSSTVSVRRLTLQNLKQTDYAVLHMSAMYITIICQM